MAVKKIVTPRPDDLAPDTFCKVKGWKQCLCKVVALESEGEVKAISLHEDPTFSIHSLDRTGSAAVYFITLTTCQALARLTQ